MKVIIVGGVAGGASCAARLRSQFQGSVVGNLTSRRGLVLATEAHGAETRIEGEVPLAETFGYSTDLRA